MQTAVVRYEPPYLARSDGSCGYRPHQERMSVRVSTRPLRRANGLYPEPRPGYSAHCNRPLLRSINNITRIQHVFQHYLKLSLPPRIRMLVPFTKFSAFGNNAPHHKIRQLGAVELRKRIAQGDGKLWRALDASIRQQVKTKIVQTILVEQAYVPLNAAEVPTAS